MAMGEAVMPHLTPRQLGRYLDARGTLFEREYDKLQQTPPLSPQ